jgi:hypothetical protein
MGKTDCKNNYFWGGKKMKCKKVDFTVNLHLLGVDPNSSGADPFLPYVGPNGSCFSREL